MNNTQEATFGAGCFWSVEELFCTIPGVIDTEVGFMGGEVENVSYKDVCNGDTGHAEVVHMHYNPEQVSYEELLKVFWDNHDSTQLNRQGPDVGEQYRSVIFYHTDEQKDLATKSKQKQEESGKHSEPVVTAIEEAQVFYKAEEYHQKYLQKQGLKVCH